MAIHKKTKFEKSLEKIKKIFEKPDEYKIICVYGPPGEGKTIFLESFIKEKQKEWKILKYDKTLNQENDIDALLIARKVKNIPKIKKNLLLWKKNKSMGQIILTIISIILTPIIFLLDRNKLVIGIILFIFIFVIFGIYSFYLINLKRKNKRIIIIENIDKNEVNMIINILKKMQNSSNHFIFSCSKKISKIQNFITNDIDLSKNKNEVRTEIIQEIFKENELGSKFLENNLKIITNFKIIKKIGEFIHKNSNFFNFYKINKEIFFLLKYLNKMDEKAYSWFKNNWKDVKNYIDENYKEITKMGNAFKYLKRLDGENKHYESLSYKIKDEQIPKKVKKSPEIYKLILRLTENIKYDENNYKILFFTKNDLNLFKDINNEKDSKKKYNLLEKNKFDDEFLKNKILLELLPKLDFDTKLKNIDFYIDKSKDQQKILDYISKFNISKLDLLESLKLILLLFSEIITLKPLNIHFINEKQKYKILVIFEKLNYFYNYKIKRNNEKNQKMLEEIKKIVKKIEKNILNNLKKIVKKENFKTFIINIKNNNEYIHDFIFDISIMTNQKLEYPEDYEHIIKNKILFPNKIFYLNNFIALFYSNNKNKKIKQMMKDNLNIKVHIRNIEKSKLVVEKYEIKKIDEMKRKFKDMEEYIKKISFF